MSRLPRDGLWRKGNACVYRNAASFGGDAERLYVCGHSSGGHLAGVLLTTDWQKDQCLLLSVGAICPGRSVGAGCARRGDARAPRLRRLAPKRLLALS